MPLIDPSQPLGLSNTSNYGNRVIVAGDSGLLDACGDPINSFPTSYGLLIRCDGCGEICDTQPIIEDETVLCLGCAATKDTAVALNKVKFSPQKLKKLLSKSKRKVTGSEAIETEELRLVQ